MTEQADTSSRSEPAANHAAGERSVKPAGTNTALTGWVLPIGINIVLPVITYFVLTALGLGDVPALLLSGVWPAAEIAVTLHRERHVDEFGIFVLIGVLAGVVTGLVSGNARDLFFKDSVTGMVIGLSFLVSLLARKPLTFYLGRRFATDGSRVQRDWWDGLWVHPRFRTVQRSLCVAWGLSLLIESSVRAILTLRLGTTGMVVVNNVLPYVVIGVMIAVSATVGRREQARADRLSRGGARPPTAT